MRPPTTKVTTGNQDSTDFSTLWKNGGQRATCWLSRDPLGELADPLHNLYRFVGNNPLNYVDPFGLYRFDEFTEDAANFSAGWGDTLTTIPFTDLSLTREFRNLLPGIYGDNGGVNRSSLTYGLGEWGGIANSLILGARAYYYLV